MERDLQQKCIYHDEIIKKMDSIMELKDIVKNLQSVVEILQETTITQKNFYHELNDLHDSIVENRLKIADTILNKRTIIILILVMLSILGVNIINIVGVI